MTSSGGKPVVSVLMLAVNRPQFIDTAIGSLRAQDFAAWELLIIHDGDDMRIKESVGPWLRKDSRIRYFHRQTMGSMANAWNFGGTQARGEFIGILDDDDAWLHPNKLRMQIACLGADPGIACVGGGAIVVDGKGKEVMRYLKPLQSDACRERALLANPLIHSTVVFRKRAAATVGWYDESLHGYMDWDLWLKIMRYSRVTNLAEYFATYRIWDEGGSSRNVMSNAWSALRIVNRHRRFFPRYPSALMVTLSYLAFALLPGGIRKRSYQGLSRLKKRLFAHQLPLF